MLLKVLIISEAPSGQQSSTRAYCRKAGVSSRHPLTACHMGTQRGSSALPLEPGVRLSRPSTALSFAPASSWAASSAAGGASSAGDPAPAGDLHVKEPIKACYTVQHQTGAGVARRRTSKANCQLSLCTHARTRPGRCLKIWHARWANCRARGSRAHAVWRARRLLLPERLRQEGVYRRTQQRDLALATRRSRRLRTHASIFGLTAHLRLPVVHTTRTASHAASS